MMDKHNSSKEMLSRVYEQHHQEGGRYGFLFGGEKRASIFADWIGSGKKVLDIGCRDGTLTQHYVAGNEVIGVDVDREALAICAQQLGIETHWHDVTAGLPFANGRFDVVVCGEILEHIPYPPLALAEITRLLKPQGLIVGSVPNAFRLVNRLKFLVGKDFEVDPTHLHHFSPSSLRLHLDPHFTQITLQYIGGRFLRLSPPLMAGDICFRAVRRAI
jgi:2-polyprenyl-3-methyl-5-hydroxy-6-metoxy-1,4-benzoquinol methylase